MRNLSREQMLHEMRLGPLWKLRRPAGQPMVAAATTEATETVAQSLAIAPDRAAVAEPPAAPLQTPPADAAGIEQVERMEVERMDWDALGSTVANCRRCALCAARKQAVLGVGDRRADWLFVGEGPGAEEDERGEPFVGQAGKLLDNMLAAIGLRRGEDVYIANAVKCRPPANRTPEAEEIAACRPYLQRQIALLRPKLIVALGRPAAQALLQSEVKIAAARGRLHDLDGLPVIVTYHPAYLLRNLPDKAKAWEDLCLMRRTMRELKTNG